MVKKNVIFGMILVFLGSILIPSNLILGAVLSSNGENISISSINEKLSSTGYFVENKGQWEKDILFVGDTDFGRVIFRNDLVQYQLIQYGCNKELSSIQHNPVTKSTKNSSSLGSSYQSYTVNLRYPESSPVTIEGDDPMSTLFNYFHGDDPSQWAIQCQAFQQITYQNLWDGIDLTYFFSDEGLKYEFILYPDADSSQLNIYLEGADLLLREDNAHLQLQTPLGTLVEAPLYTYGASSKKAYPVSFIDVTPIRHSHEEALVPTSDFRHPGHSFLKSQKHTEYSFLSKTILSFTGIPPAPRKETLVIDPLIRSTYVGGSTAGAIVTSLSIGPKETVYVAGDTMCPHFPKTAGGAEQNKPSWEAGFVAHFSSDLSELYQATYIGGDRESYTWVLSLAVHEKDGSVYAAGLTNSFSFPNTSGGAQSSKGATKRYKGMADYDGFIAKLSPDLTTLHQSTYLGGSEGSGINSIAISAEGMVYVVGSTSSKDFPKTAEGANPRSDFNDYYGRGGFISQLSGDLTMLHQSTYASNLENSLYGPEWSTIKCSPDDSVFVNDRNSIRKYSSDLKNRIEVFKTDNFGQIQAFDIAPDNTVYIVGSTTRNDLQKTNMAAQETKNGKEDGFVVKLSSNLRSIIRSTYIGGSGIDVVYSIAISDAFDLYIAGKTDSYDLPEISGGALSKKSTRPAYYFITRISSDLSLFHQSTYVGESVIGRKFDVPNLAVTNSRFAFISCETSCKTLPGLAYGFQKTMPYSGYYGRSEPLGNSFISRVYFPTLEEVIVYLQIGSTDADLVKEGKKHSIKIDVAPQTIQARTMVPLRFIAEAFNVDVEWIANIKSIRLVRGDTMIVMQIDSTVVYINERKVTIDAPPVIRNGRTLVPVRFIAENIGYDVEWFAYTKVIKVSQ
jgi:hypothetical protein